MDVLPIVAALVVGYFGYLFINEYSENTRVERLISHNVDISRNYTKYIK